MANPIELKRLLEKAAKVAGLQIQPAVDPKTGVIFQGSMPGLVLVYIKIGHRVVQWAPHTDDGDSRRLEVVLGIKFQQIGDEIWAGAETTGLGSISMIQESISAHSGDTLAAIRFAVLRAAAAQDMMK